LSLSWCKKALEFSIARRTLADGPVAGTEFEEWYRAVTPQEPRPRPQLHPEVLITPPPTIESVEKYSSDFEDDPVKMRNRIVDPFSSRMSLSPPRGNL
jgi:hypothetical protein